MIKFANSRPGFFSCGFTTNENSLNNQECNVSSAVLVSFLKDPNQHGGMIKY